MLYSRRLIGLWLIGISLTMIIGYILSLQERSQWYPIGEMYNFYYSIIIGLCVIAFTSLKFFSIQFKWKVLLILFIWTIIYALVFGIVFPEKITNWRGSLEYRPPNLFNLELSLKTILIGSSLISLFAGILLMFKTNK